MEAPGSNEGHAAHEVKCDPSSMIRNPLTWAFFPGPLYSAPSPSSRAQSGWRRPFRLRLPSHGSIAATAAVAGRWRGTAAVVARLRTPPRLLGRRPALAAALPLHCGRRIRMFCDSQWRC